MDPGVSGTRFFRVEIPEVELPHVGVSASSTLLANIDLFSKELLPICSATSCV